ncbi:MAG: hypothetical protein LBG66_06490 [Gallionellaceae bacterium]|nr:hypothetical protein [Gallionellaceae bacterium]
MSILAFVFIGPMEAQDGNYQVSRFEIWVTRIISVCFAAGAFAVARRGRIGIFLLSLPVLPCFFIGELLFGVIFLGLAPAVYGISFLWVLWRHGVVLGQRFDFLPEPACP